MRAFVKNAMKRMGNTGYSGLPTASLFTCRDGREISLGVVQENQFRALARLVGRADWLTDARYASPAGRRSNFEAMHRELSDVFATRDACDWEQLLSAQGVPCGMVRTVNEAVELAREDALLRSTIPGMPQSLAIPNAGFTMEPGSPGTDEPPPRLDEHREEILEWLRCDGAVLQEGSEK